MSQAFWDSLDGVYKQWIRDLGDSSLWDTAFLGGQQLPGIVKAEGEVGRKWDVKSAPGSDGATITDQGYEPAKPMLTVVIWTPEHWTAWEALLPTFAPKPGKRPKGPPPPLAISHPALNSLGINNVLVLSVSAMKPGSVHGAFESQIKLVEWLKPVKAQVTNAQFKSSTRAGTEGGVGSEFRNPPSASKPQP